MSLPQAGHDEIVLSAPDAEYLCFLADHTIVGWHAQFIVTFGQFGTPGVDAMWPQSWGRSYLMCRYCADGTIELVKEVRPNLVVRDLTQPRARPPSLMPGGRGVTSPPTANRPAAYGLPQG
jgi:hypothetical protein